MGKLRVLSGRDACRILEQHGFQIVRQRGSHIVMQRRMDRGTVTVPFPITLNFESERSNRSFAKAGSLAQRSRSNL